MSRPEDAEATAVTVPRVLGGLCLAQLVGWSMAPMLSHAAPPLDVVEMYVWGREGVVATFKHPNLPGLVLEATRRLTGGAIWPSYVVSQLCVVGAYLGVFALGRELVGRRRALAATLLLTGIVYYSWPTPEMNHNVAQIPLWPLIALALWRAVATDRWLWWTILGVAGGLVLWAKYTAALLLVVCAAWLLIDRVARATLRRPGPWLALGLSVLVAAPQIHYVISSGFLPLDNAMLRATGIESDPWLEFLLAQGVAQAMLLVMAAVAGLFGRGARSAPDDPQWARKRLFVTVLGLGPTFLICLAAMVFDVGLRDMWGTPMYGLSGLLLLAWLPGRFDAAALRRIVRFAAVLLVLVPAAYAASVVTRPRLKDRPARVNWPQARIAEHFVDLFERETGAPLAVVAGPPWEAGLIALTAPSEPSVSLEGSTVRAPWVRPEELERHGFLAVWPEALGPSESLAALMARHGVRAESYRTVELSWSDRATAQPVAIGFVVVPPLDPG